MHRSLLLYAALALCTAMPASASTGSSPESDGAKFVRLTKQLELDPLGDEDKSVHTWLIGWATESEDVSVVVCDVLGPIPSQDLPYGSNLLTQMIFGNAAFQISYPDRKGDVQATQVAGVRSAVRSYASIIATHPEARIPYFDDLLDKEQKGALVEYLAPVISDKCNKSDGA